MLPWSREFTWDAGHLLFFGALYAVLATIAASLFVATRRALRQSASRAAWPLEFAALPVSARCCRHQLTGESPGRVCANGFDCRSCAHHRSIETLRRTEGTRLPEDPLESLESRRFYHRGHTWARIERNGTVTVGLDGLARHLLGTPEQIELPQAGARLEVNGTLGWVTTRRVRVRLLSPVEGTLVGVTGTGLGFRLRVQPEPTLDVRHLLAGPEAKLWALRELERLQLALRPAGTRAALADGGELVPDVGAAVDRRAYDQVLGDLFLEA